jgi:hypothetical protein
MKGETKRIKKNGGQKGTKGGSKEAIETMGGSKKL